jgi:hypothetical protein
MAEQDDDVDDLPEFEPDDTPIGMLPTARGPQPQDEADRAEHLAARNEAPENGTTADASRKSGDKVQEPQTGGVSRPGGADGDIQRRVADDTSYERNGENKE